ncbi:MAG: hypothetical protein JWM92_334 [Candidatus Nomurabacteria bacterium]|jgi:hypothetical protein|nr:hypothetical protein [Candidatus Nomurabacteria bacterium]
MIKRLSLIVLFFVMMLSVGKVSAAAALPSSAVWFTPASASVGSAITLNALVYNNQSVSATVTVTFTNTTSKEKIAAMTDTIAAQSAKTITANWIMPAKNTVVTATVTGAFDKNKKSLPALLGVLGTVTVGNTPTPLINGISFPGSTQLNAWFTPVLTTMESFRKKEAISFAHMRDSNPGNSVTNTYYTMGASLFTNPAFFYIAALLLLLLLLRFIVNLIF